MDESFITLTARKSGAPVHIRSKKITMVARDGDFAVIGLGSLKVRVRETPIRVVEMLREFGVTVLNPLDEDGLIQFARFTLRLIDEKKPSGEYTASITFEHLKDRLMGPHFEDITLKTDNQSLIANLKEGCMLELKIVGIHNVRR